jgi:hypothetical protein
VKLRRETVSIDEVGGLRNACRDFALKCGPAGRDRDPVARHGEVRSDL